MSAGTFPLDTTKTRLQVQGQFLDRLCHQSRYRGMIHALYRISQEEGVRALYKGYVSLYFPLCICVCVSSFISPIYIVCMRAYINFVVYKNP